MLGGTGAQFMYFHSPYQVFVSEASASHSPSYDFCAGYNNTLPYRGKSFVISAISVPNKLACNVQVVSFP